MSLDTTTVAETPASGSETTTATQDAGGVLASRYEGIIDLDKTEPAKANPTEEESAEAPAETPAEVPEGTEKAEQEAEDQPTEQPDIWAGYEEVEIDGKKLKIPTEAKEFLMKDADYRRKTQEVSVRRKELDAREAQIVERQNLTDQEISAHVALSQVNEQLKEFEGIDWHSEFVKAQNSDDPLAETRLNTRYAQFQELRSLQQGGQNFLNEAAKQRTEEANRQADNRLTATTDFARKNLTKLGWNEDVAGQVNAWLINEHGATWDTIRATYNPTTYPLIFKAFLWDQSEKRQQKTKPSPVTPQAPATPTTVVSAKASPNATPDLNKVSMAEYVRLRSAGKT